MALSIEIRHPGRRGWGEIKKKPRYGVVGGVARRRFAIAR